MSTDLSHQGKKEKNKILSVRGVSDNHFSICYLSHDDKAELGQSFGKNSGIFS